MITGFNPISGKASLLGAPDLRAELDKYTTKEQHRKLDTRTEAISKSLDSLGTQVYNVASAILAQERTKVYITSDKKDEVTVCIMDDKYEGRDYLFAVDTDGNMRYLYRTTEEHFKQYYDIYTDTVDKVDAVSKINSLDVPLTTPAKAPLSIVPDGQIKVSGGDDRLNAIRAKLRGDQVVQPQAMFTPPSKVVPHQSMDGTKSTLALGRINLEEIRINTEEGARMRQIERDRKSRLRPHDLGVTSKIDHTSSLDTSKIDSLAAPSVGDSSKSKIVLPSASIIPEFTLSVTKPPRLDDIKARLDAEITPSTLTAKQSKLDDIKARIRARNDTVVQPQTMFTPPSKVVPHQSVDETKSTLALGRINLEEIRINTEEGARMRQIERDRKSRLRPHDLGVTSKIDSLATPSVGDSSKSKMVLPSTVVSPSSVSIPLTNKVSKLDGIKARLDASTKSADSLVTLFDTKPTATKDTNYDVGIPKPTETPTGYWGTLITNTHYILF